MSVPATCDREYDFALVLRGVHELTTEIEDALFEAGCDDATISVQYGNLYLEFSRKATSMKEAIISAILDVRKANIGAEVVRVDDCNLVTQADIARRIERPRQVVHQYISGQRGPGGFPAPDCYLTENKPLWAWCSVSYWLWQNNMLREDQMWEAEVVAAINNALEQLQQRRRHPELVSEVSHAVGSR